MSDFVGLLVLCFVCVMFFFFAGGCADEQTKAQIIKDNGFCIHSEVAGQKFEKCYELKEIKKKENGV